MKHTRRQAIVQATIGAFLLGVAATCIYPFLFVVATAFSSESAVVSGKVWLWPVEPTLQTFRVVLALSPIPRALANTVTVTAVGTAINIVLTVLAAYSLSKPHLVGRKTILIAIAFTMLFRAGMIPDYVLVRSLGLVDTYWALWLPLGISAFNLIVLKTFFQQLPASLEESAAIDGAPYPTILLLIVLPLSRAALATIGLFYAVTHWNSYMHVLIYITSTAKYTLQVRLRQLLLDASVTASISNAVQQVEDVQQLSPESVKAASIVIATVPVLLVYPVLQRHFMSGLMIGSLKG